MPIDGTSSANTFRGEGINRTTYKSTATISLITTRLIAQVPTLTLSISELALTVYKG